MRKTLYDLLEVSRTASAEAIHASYERLRNHFQAKADGGDQDARIQLTAVREAYQTLSDATRRSLYDVSLDSPPTARTASTAVRGLYDVSPDEGLSRKALIIGAIGLTIAAFVGYRMISDYQTKAELAKIEKLQSIERERLELDRKRAEAAEAAEQHRLNTEQQRLQMERERQDTAFARQRAIEDQNWRTRSTQERVAFERQKVAEERQKQREEQMAQDRERLEAERRVREDKELLRRICMQRYNRPDC